MKRMVLILTITVMAAGFAARNAAAGTLDMLPPDLQDKVNNLMATRWPPLAKSVTLDPEAPAADQAVSVTAEVFNDTEVTEDETSEVYLIYTTDGGATWNQVELEQQDNEKLWTGEIPGQPSGTEVLYGIKALDSSGNVYVEAVCKMPGSPLEIEDYIDNDCVNKGDVSLCEAKMPRGCMFPLSSDDSPLNDEAALISDDFDFWDYRIGYDDDNVYMDLAVEGKVSPGTASPMNIHLYIGGVLNPDKPASGTGLDAIARQGGAFIHGPLLTLSGGLAKPCSFLYQKGNTAVQDETAIKCIAKRNHLLYVVKRSAIGDNPSNILEFLALSAAGTSISPVNGALYDNSHFTNVRLESRSYKVE